LFNSSQAARVDSGFAVESDAARRTATAAQLSVFAICARAAQRITAILPVIGKPRRIFPNLPQGFIAQIAFDESRSQCQAAFDITATGDAQMANTSKTTEPAA
jgi:hypothetical protein